jgi:hypothetical protein
MQAVTTIQIINENITEFREDTAIINDGVFDVIMQFIDGSDGRYTISIINGSSTIIKFKHLKTLYHNCGCKLSEQKIIAIADEQTKIEIKRL